MYYPTFEDVKELSARATGTEHAQDSIPLVALSFDLMADLETPISVYCKVSTNNFSFLFEGVEAGERITRYSCIGIDPYLVVAQRGERAQLLRMRDDEARVISPTFEEVVCHDPLQLVELEMARFRLVTPANLPRDEQPNFQGGAVGYLAYEAAACFEKLPLPEHDELNLPLAIFSFTRTVVIFDHLKQRIRMQTHLRLDAPDLAAAYLHATTLLDAIAQRLGQPLRLPQEPPPAHEEAELHSNCMREEYEEMVRKSIDYIRAGDIFQVVPSQRLSRRVNAAPLTVYRTLRSINPSPYMFFLDMKDFHIVGTSPELLVRCMDNNIVLRPIAGTRPRGIDKQSDEALAVELKNHPKECAEHVMLLDLARNDAGRVSEPGSVRVDDFMRIERYSQVMHLVTTVSGQLRAGISSFEALRAAFPAGTVSGAPKLRAMEIISELEGERRGVYAGAVGYFSYAGRHETAIALRTMIIKEGRAYIQVGAGVVADSDPASEYQECLNKARALLDALNEAEHIARLHL